MFQATVVQVLNSTFSVKREVELRSHGSSAGRTVRVHFMLDLSLSSFCFLFSLPFPVKIHCCNDPKSDFAPKCLCPRKETRTVCGHFFF